MNDRINEAISKADPEGVNVGNAVVIGKDENGFWVSDNGEEVNGLTAEEAARIAGKNLNQ